MSSTSVAALAILLTQGTHLPPDPTGDDTPPTVAQVRELLSWLEPTDMSPRELMKLGERAFPAYEKIIADPKSSREHIARALGIISDVKADRSRFLNPAVEFLAHESAGVRSAALGLLAEIGSDRDTAPIIALLSDEDNGIRRAAAKTLGKLGGRRDVVALDIWLKGGNIRNDGVLAQLVKKARDEIEQRLKDNAKPKDAKDCPAKP